MFEILDYVYVIEDALYTKPKILQRRKIIPRFTAKLRELIARFDDNIGGLGS